MRITLITIALLSVNFVIGQNNIEKQLIGTWKFIEMHDAKGKKIPERIFIEGIGECVQAMNRPDIIFEENGEYTMLFTPANIDYGIWSFDPSTNKISYELRISPNDEHIELLKTISRKATDGYYYQEPMIHSILSINKNVMIIEEYVGVHLVYRKEN